MQLGFCAFCYAVHGGCEHSNVYLVEARGYKCRVSLEGGFIRMFSSDLNTV